MESADTTSPLCRRASSTAKAVLPEAVGPQMTKIFGGIDILLCSVGAAISRPPLAHRYSGG